MKRGFFAAVVAIGVVVFGCKGVGVIKPKVGDACTKGLGACLDDHTELACQNGTYISAPCRGPKGCQVQTSPSSSTATMTCDASANQTGDPCSTDDEDTGACSADGKQAIECNSGKWQVFACSGEKGCTSKATQIVCDERATLDADAFCTKALGEVATFVQSKCSKKERALSDVIVGVGGFAEKITFCREWMTSITENNRGTIDASKKDACAAAIAAAGQTAMAFPASNYHDRPLAECAGLVTGSQDVGKPCGSRLECKDGLVCSGYWKARAASVKDTSGKAKAEGTCAKLGGPGDPCDADDSIFPELGGISWQCAAGLHCDYDTATSSSKCSAAKKDGEDCMFDSDCSAPSECVVNKCAPGPAAQKLGENCGTFDCATGLQCEATNPSLGAGHKCAPKKAAGEKCVISEDCRGRCLTPKDAAIGTEGKCVEVCGVK
jgi:hypothetical protein